MLLSSGRNVYLRGSLTIQTGKFYGVLIQTGSALSHNWPDITFFNKSKADTKLIDIAIPGDFWVSQKSVEKRHRYRDLSVIVNRLHLLF